MRLAVSLVLLSAACSDQSVVVGGLQEVASMKALPNPDLDILFVIDNSPSMADKQTSLAASFPTMMDVLGQLDGGLPNLHIGVVTSDMGTSGSGSTTPGSPIGTSGNGGCAGVGDDGLLKSVPGMTATFLEDITNPDGTRTKNYTGELRDMFGSLAKVGAGGCGFEQHLASMRRALTNPANTGFLRPGANLAVVILADEDDCSAIDPALFGPASSELGELTSFRCFSKGVTCAPDSTSIGPKSGCSPAGASTYVEDVAPFVQTLLETKPDPRMLMVGAIVGDPDTVAVELRQQGGGSPVPSLAHSCTYNGLEGPQVADPAVRLSSFLDAFPDRSTLTSICSADLSTPLGHLGETAKRLIGDPCLDSSLLADTSSEPGVQPACVVYEVRDSEPGNNVDVPACGAGDSNCYELLADAAACPATQDHLRLHVRRQGLAAPDAWTHVRCKLAP